MQGAKDQARNLGTIQEAVHPLYKEVFQSQARTSDEIRTLRDFISGIVCASCHKLEKDKKFSRCGKDSRYCSKECQRQHWPTHKESCKQVDGSGIMKLVLTLLANDYLSGLLQAALIQKFNLLDTKPPNEPVLRAHIDIGVEPTDILYFLDVFMGKEKGPTPRDMRGMLQVNPITPIPTSMPDLLSTEFDAVWRRSRESPSAQYCYGIMEFGKGEGEQVVAAPMLIHPPAMEFVRQARPWQRISAVTGEATIVPFSFNHCIETMNEHIRADKENQLLLRTALRPSDVQLIRDAAAKRDTHAADMVRRKMAREDVYQLVFVDTKDGTQTVKRVKLVEDKDSRSNGGE